MEMKLQWGTELWDKYTELCSHTSSGIDFLDSQIAAFVKERGKVEFEYAKSLRALVKRFTPKEPAPLPEKKPDKNAPQGSGPVSIISLSTPAEEEYSHVMAFKQVCKKNYFKSPGKVALRILGSRRTVHLLMRTLDVQECNVN